MHGSRRCAEAELRPNHLGTRLSLGETETWRSCELRKPTRWRLPKWLRTEFSIGGTSPLNKAPERELRSPIKSGLRRPSTFPVRTLLHPLVSPGVPSGDPGGAELKEKHAGTGSNDGGTGGR